MDPHRSNNAELRYFGLLFGAFLSTLFSVIPLLRHHFRPAWPWIVAALLGLLAFLVPAALAYPHRQWIRLGSALGWLKYPRAFVSGVPVDRSSNCIVDAVVWRRSDDAKI